MDHPLTWPQRGRLWLRLGLRFLLAAGLILAGKYLLPPLFALFAPFFFGFLLACALDPAVRSLQRRLGWSRGLLALVTTGVLFSLLGAALVGAVYATGRELVALAQNWEELAASSTLLWREVEGLFARFWAVLPQEILEVSWSLWEKLAGWLQDSLSALLTGAAGYVKDAAVGMPGFFLSFFMFLMATYFFAAELPYLRIRMLQTLDDGARCRMEQLRKVALAAFGGYLKAQLLLSAGVFAILLGGFLLTGQEYAFLLALGLAVLDFIPLLGAGTAMVPWAGVALVTRDYSRAVAVILVWGAVALFRRVAEPKILGDQTGLSPVAALASIYVGMKAAGVLGMILGPIVTLVFLNLAGLGVFHGFRMDVEDFLEDVGGLMRR